jgi:hypothetical protein
MKLGCKMCVMFERSCSVHGEKMTSKEYGIRHYGPKDKKVKYNIDHTTSYKQWQDQQKKKIDIKMSGERER